MQPITPPPKVDFEGEPNWGGMANAERLARAARWKEQGNQLYKQAGGRGNESCCIYICG